MSQSTFTDKPVIFYAEILRVQMMASDSAIRVTLDLGEGAIDTAAWLMEIKRSGKLVLIKAEVYTDTNR